MSDTPSHGVGQVDRVELFDRLAREMNEHPERYEPLGDISLRLAIVVNRPDGSALRVLLRFEGVRCEEILELPEGAERDADCWLEGPVEAWQAMFDDVVHHGRATGRNTINSLTLIGDRIAVHGVDPLGVDRFFRYNQTIQACCDGASAAAATAAPA